jgi:glycosyltransferase involved in cell wall biosynthesis
LDKGTSKIVTILWRFLPQYRVDFFYSLKETLAKSDINLNLVYGKNRYVPRRDEVDIDWATPIKNWTFRFGNQQFYWQPLPGNLWHSDLIILMQENRIVSNYYILLRSLLSKQKVAFWDHGLNLQADPNSLGNHFKKIYSTKVFWWFAYTEGVKKIIVDMGFPENRITVVDNAIDTISLIRESEKIGKEQIDSLKKELEIGAGPIGLFCGGMYREKRIDFLIEACREIRGHVPNFQMVFVGEGPESHKIIASLTANRWIHYVGPKFGFDRIPYFKMADVFLMPGAVGLAILDCFALETPIITTKHSYHGPEIEYLVSGENGIMTKPSIDSFKQGILKVLASNDLKDRLKQGCKRGAARYTLENMIYNFSEGIKKALLK